MKTFTTSHSRIETGLRIQDDERLGRVVAMGEDGRGREYTKVKLDGRTQPTVTDGKVLDAGLVEFEAGGRKRHALVAGKPGDRRILVRVYTGATYTRGCSGSACEYWGDAKRITGGYGAFGDAGRLGTWDDALWVLNPGDAVFVKPSGGHKTEAYVISYDGNQPKCWPVEEYRTEVLGPWLATAAPEAKTAAIAKARARGNNKLAEYLEAGGAVETAREI